MSKYMRLNNGLELAGGLGFEPRLAESESAVLPLDDPPPGERRAGKLGRQPPGLTFAKLTQDSYLPLAWPEQRKALGFD